MRRSDFAVALLIVFALPPLRAQERIPAGPPANGPDFDVVSVKRVTEMRNFGSIGEQPGGRFVLSGTAIAAMIRTAYPSDTSDLIGAPDWVTADRYDVTAQAGRDVPREQMEVMLRTMLADRFKRAVHYETQELPGTRSCLLVPMAALVPISGHPVSIATRFRQRAVQDRKIRRRATRQISSRHCRSSSA